MKFHTLRWMSMSVKTRLNFHNTPWATRVLVALLLRKKNMKRIIFPILVLASAGSYADAKTDKSFNADAELGVLLTSGNTKSTALKLKLNLKQDLVKWRNEYNLEGLYKKDTVSSVTEGTASEESQVTADKYFLSAQSDYKLDEDYQGLFIYASYGADKFSGYQYQGTLAGGYSNRLFKSDASYLTYSVGPGVAFTKTDDTVDTEGNPVVGLSDETTIIRLSGFYQWDISDTAKFTQVLSSDVALDSESNTQSKSESAITAQLNATFSVKASYTVTHNSETPENIKNVDALTSVTLVYSF